MLWWSSDCTDKRLQYIALSVVTMKRNNVKGWVSFIMIHYSHSVVPGGFDVTSRHTLEIVGTFLIASTILFIVYNEIISLNITKLNICIINSYKSLVKT